MVVCVCFKMINSSKVSIFLWNQLKCLNLAHTQPIQFHEEVAKCFILLCREIKLDLTEALTVITVQNCNFSSLMRIGNLSQGYHKKVEMTLQPHSLSISKLLQSVSFFLNDSKIAESLNCLFAQNSFTQPMVF